MARSPTLIGIVGWKNSGKTTLIERLIPILAAGGLKVATVKHTHHALRPHDGATDGERHRRAGAVETIVIGPDAWEMSGVVQPGPPPDLAQLGLSLEGADVVLVEGFKRAPIPKIEVRRRASSTQQPLAPGDPSVIAVAADHAVDAHGLPLFGLADVEAVAEFIAGTVEKSRR